MRMDTAVKTRMIRNILLSLFIYALPVALMLAALWWRGDAPWSHPANAAHTGLFWRVSDWLNGNGFVELIVLLGLAEFTLGRYGEHWRGNETVLDIVCFA